MSDFSAARRTMVDCQIRPSDVTDPRLLEAMLDIPRERFVADAQAAIAYLDCDLPVGTQRRSRRLLKPMVLAKLLQAAEIGPADRVLDVGCVTGYSSAVLARLAGEVVALEEDAELADRAGKVLRDLGAGNVSVVCGALNAGWPGQAPYDVIVLNGVAEVIPAALLGEIKDGGRLVGILGAGPAGKAMLYRSVRGEVSGRPIFDAAGPPLPGFAKPLEFVF